MGSIVKEFKDFILKGNVIDMAVGIIIGAAFGTVVKSLVANIIMPPIGLLLGGIDFSKLKIVLKDEVKEGADVVTEAVSINYGTAFNDIITLVIVGFCVFVLVKAYNTAKAKMAKEEAPKEEAPAGPSDEVKLLTEIRDVLAKK